MYVPAASYYSTGAEQTSTWLASHDQCQLYCDRSPALGFGLSVLSPKLSDQLATVEYFLLVNFGATIRRNCLNGPSAAPVA